jgi:hypothetical protein
VTFTRRILRLAIAGVAPVFVYVGNANAQGVVAVGYGPPVVVTPYHPVQRVAYYPAPVAYYAPPVYAPVVPVVPGAVTAVKYGPLGRPRAATTYYFPGYVLP